MDSRTHTDYERQRRADIHCFNIPIECIRKTRSLNIDMRSRCVSWEVYKIMKSDNGRKMFA